MKLGFILPLVVGSLALTGMVFTFVNQATPYVTVKEAQAGNTGRVHLPGEMVQESIQVASKERIVRFTLKDEKGDQIPVVYQGNAPANMGTSTKVVVIGRVEEGVFQANDMLIKCPTKYESESKLPQGMKPVGS
jgi:cytochrome c-type biogenesis protein CcmE